MVIQFNVLPFDFKAETIVVSLSKSKKKTNDVPLEKTDAPISAIDLFAGAGGLYTSFDNNEERDFKGIEVKLSKSRHFALHYARYLLREHVWGKQGMIVSPNFIKDLDIWYRYQNKDFSTYSEYLACTIKFQDRRATDRYEMVISYEGNKRVAKTPLLSLPPESRDTYSQVVYDGVKYRYSDEDAPFWSHLDVTYPVLTPELEDVLKIPHMAKKSPFTNKYDEYTKRVEWIQGWIRRQEPLAAVFDFSGDSFLKAKPEDILSVSQDAFNLAFEDGFITKDIVAGFKNHGPYSPGCRNLRLIFMYQDTLGAKQARDKYESFLLHGLKLPARNGGTYSAITPLSMSTKQMAFANSADDLVFSNLATAPEEIERQFRAKLASYGDLNNCLVIYVSPISNNSTSSPYLDIIYGQLKELFVNFGVPMQGIYAERVKDNGVQYSFTNIQAAVCAKTRGIPWRIANACEDDLIFGVGAYRPQGKGKKYLGSAFAFDGTGVMKEFSCFQNDTPAELTTNLKKAIRGFIDDCQKPPRRIIIHFYKKMNRDEWEPIYKMLKNGLGKEIPVVVVTITLTDSQDIMAYDTSCADKMPLAGTYLKIGKSSYLLFNNSKYSQTDWDASRKKKVHHFPIKIQMESRNSNILDDASAVHDIITQIFQLSRMYWKSVDQQSIPITVKYPSIIARFLPLFREEVIPNQAFGCKTLWFL